MDLFDPPDAEWQRVSPKLAVVRRAVLLLLLAAVAVGLGTVAALTAVPSALVSAAFVLLAAGAVWGWWVIGRSVTRIGYAEMGEELYLTRGAFFRRLVVVPYGRMQYVDVHAGPVEQLNGIATLHLHTASPGTSAVIPGIPAVEAARLRDRLTQRGETQAAGL